MLGKPTIIAGLAGLIAGLAIGWQVENWRKSAQLAEVLERQAAATVAQVQAVREEEARRLTESENAIHYAEAQISGLEMVLDAAAVESDGLRRDLQAWKRGQRLSCPAAAAGGSPSVEGSDPLGLLIELLGGVEGEGRRMAEYADRLKVAGEACERLWDGIRQGK